MAFELAGINAAIKAILKLLKLKKEAKKDDLEIERLEREKKEAGSLVRIATFEETKEYGGKYTKLVRWQTRIRNNWVITLALPVGVALAVGSLAAKFYREMSAMIRALARAVADLF